MSATTQPPKKYKAKQFRVAVEGATTDGRRIERSWIQQMAANYKPATYAARVNLEHLRSLYPDSTFRSYGDVTAVEAREVTDEGPLKGKLALYATIDPLPELVTLNKARQKIFSSIEINPKFGDTGEAYLMGIAVTDNPASLGTEMLEFSAKAGAASPLAARKTSPECLFTAAEELVGMDFEEISPSEDSVGKFSAKLKGLIERFSGRSATDDARFGAVTEALEATADAYTRQAEQITQAQAAATKATADLAALSTQFASLKIDHDALVKKLNLTDADPKKRPPATGGAGTHATDC